MKWKALQKAPVKTFLIAFCVLNLIYAVHLKIQSDHILQKKIHKITHGIHDDEEKAIKLTNLVYNINANSVGSVNVLYNLKNFGIFGALYGILPLNLIPADVTLTRGFVYTGPCGAKSRLLHSLFSMARLKSRMISLHDAKGVPTHTLVEVYLDGVYTPIDPTYGLFIKDYDGNFVETRSICTSVDVNIISSKKIGNNNYIKEFCNITRFSVKDAIISTLRTARVINSDYSNLNKIQRQINEFLPNPIINADFSGFFLYNDTRSLYISMSLFILLIVSSYCFKKQINSFFRRP